MGPRNRTPHEGRGPRSCGYRKSQSHHSMTPAEIEAELQRMALPEDEQVLEIASMIAAFPPDRRASIVAYATIRPEAKQTKH